MARRPQPLVTRGNSLGPLQPVRTYKPMSTRRRVVLAIENTGLETTADAISILLALLSVVTYVVGTYHHDQYTQETFSIINLCLSIIFGAQYLFSLWLCESRTAFILNYQSIIDALTIFPGFVDFAAQQGSSSTGSKHGPNLMFLRSFRMVRVLRILRLLRATRFFSLDVHKRLFYLAFTISGIVFCSAGFFYEFEKAAREAPISPDTLLLSGFSSPLSNSTAQALIQTELAGNEAGQAAGVAAAGVGMTAGLARLQLNGTAALGPSDVFYFHDAIYWAAVTIATVGYGDVAPITTEGRMMVALLLFLILALVPYQTSMLFDSISATNRYLRAQYWHHRRRRHVLVMGSLQYLALETFVQEFFHPDHGYQDHNMVLLAANPPDRHTRALIKSHRLAHRLTYAQGSPHTPKDLLRVAAHHAKALFVLADQQCAAPEQEDTANIMGLLASLHYLQRYHQALLQQPMHWKSWLHHLVTHCLPQSRSSSHEGPVNAVTPHIPRLFIQLLLPESQHQLLQLLAALQTQTHASSKAAAMAGFRAHHSMFWATVQADITIICASHLRHTLLAHSCLAAPGIIALVSNLGRTADLQDLHHVLPDDQRIQEDWCLQYREGAQMEVYEVPNFPPHLHGQCFGNVVRYMYHQHGCLLIALAWRTKWAPTEVWLAPFEEIVGVGMAGFIISSDLKPALKIAKDNPEDFKAWQTIFNRPSCPGDHPDMPAPQPCLSSERQPLPPLGIVSLASFLRPQSPPGTSSAVPDSQHHQPQLEDLGYQHQQEQEQGKLQMQPGQHQVPMQPPSPGGLTPAPNLARLQVSPEPALVFPTSPKTGEWGSLPGGPQIHVPAGPTHTPRHGGSPVRASLATQLSESLTPTFRVQRDYSGDIHSSLLRGVPYSEVPSMMLQHAPTRVPCTKELLTTSHQRHIHQQPHSSTPQSHRHQHQHQHHCPDQDQTCQPSLHQCQPVEHVLPVRLPNPQTQPHLSQSQLPLLESVQGKRWQQPHVLLVLCCEGILQEALAVACRLRTLRLQSLCPLVVMAAHLPATDPHVAALARLQETYFLLCDPCSFDNLQQRAAVERAGCALLLGGVQPGIVQHEASLRGEALADAAVVFAFQHLRTLNSTLDIFCQVVLSSSAAFLGPSLPFRPNAFSPEHFSPQDSMVYAAGSVLLPEVIHSITCQAFHSGHVFQLLQKLASPHGLGHVACAPGQANHAAQASPPATPVTFVSGACTESSTPHAPQPPERTLVLIPIAMDALQEPIFSEWFLYCIQVLRVLCIGLYRRHTAGSSRSSYVYTNPLPDTRLSTSDRAFVVADLAQHRHLVAGCLDTTPSISSSIRQS